ncbi:unnamed protein product [Tuber aestivum]|uniref:Uncharacterized protein n=1 Tax=Tuber aestivum TaxID=59557 RepID=A0A292PK95_9PEZI|nr:unnamed protein product [Tuber aestivum]
MIEDPDGVEAVGVVVEAVEIVEASGEVEAFGVAAEVSPDAAIVASVAGFCYRAVVAASEFRGARGQVRGGWEAEIFLELNGSRSGLLWAPVGRGHRAGPYRMCGIRRIPRSQKATHCINPTVHH